MACCFHGLLSGMDETQSEMRFQVLRVERDRTAQGGPSLGDFADPDQRGAQVPIGRRLAAAQFDRLLRTALLVQRHTQQVKRIGVVGPLRENLLEHAPRIAEAPGLHMVEPEAHRFAQGPGFGPGATLFAGRAGLARTP
jgi:hypothetical protein